MHYTMTKRLKNDLRFYNTMVCTNMKHYLKFKHTLANK